MSVCTRSGVCVCFWCSVIERWFSCISEFRADNVGALLGFPLSHAVCCLHSEKPAPKPCSSGWQFGAYGDLVHVPSNQKRLGVYVLPRQPVASDRQKWDIESLFSSPWMGTDVRCDSLQHSSVGLDLSSDSDLASSLTLNLLPPLPHLSPL